MNIRDYRSWEAFLEAANKLPSNAMAWAAGSGRAWADGVNTAGEALQIARTGWPAGMEFIRSITTPIVDKMAGTIEAHDERWGWDVTGAAYDVGEYLSGAPECWLAPTLISDKPCITIAANITSSGMIDALQLKRRGAAVVALTLALQASGYAVRAYAIVGMASDTDSEEDTSWLRWALTDDNGGPLDTDRLLFALAHPASPRVLGYGLGIDAAGKDPTREHWMPWPKGGKDARPPAEWKADLYLHAVHASDANWEDDASVSAWVASQYETLTKGGDAQ